MNMKSVAGVICLVKDLDETVEFYEALGFDFQKRVPDIAVTAYLNGFWIELLLESKAVTDAFKDDVRSVSKGAGLYIHINVENVDDYYAGVLGKGLKPLGVPQNFPWGHREFVVADPNGYKLVFFSKL